ncbi:autoinducer 2 ABC transporter substrate-binding protein [Microbacterium murale]|uniref:Sugar ABC transporter substrate-binding protein n=1 Tax=Microbacterium murale TaxID=1081040 RepID=A0ABQ1RIJ6_9MICO|nr:autoinducer 2 ABC transporter substrate-binding protein [Microbacterium murale]GGD69137.1 sugar ABC transporter substrate-binding protein [Microbacterium murale]
MIRNRSIAAAAVAAFAALALAGCTTVGGGADTDGDGGSTSAEDMTMITVVKAQTIPWFQRMAVGVDEWAEETGVDARQEGADDVSPEKQVAIVQDLIAQQPTAITVVPNSPEALANVLGQARDQGIIVVSHEATGMENVDIDIEAFDNASYGSEIMDNLGECMGGEGEYVQFVGGLTAKTHMEWVEAAYENQQENFPDMTRVETPIESTDNQETAYERAKEVLAKYPNIKGFQGSAGNDVPGIARAVQEAGLEDDICVMGTSIPSVANQYLADGSIDKIFFWDPALAGKAQLAIALILADGGTIEAGTDLGIEGYEDLQPLEGFDNVFVGNASVAADAETAAEYDF